MMRYEHTRSPLLFAALLLAALQGVGVGAEAGSPCTYVFDTGSSSPSFLPLRTLSARAGWTQLEEDDLAHKFTGEAVLANDKLTVVLRAKGCGAEVYSQTEAGLRPRAVLAPVAAGGDRASGLAALRVLENNPGAVMVEAAFAAGAERLTLTYRLTTGQGTVEIRPGQNTAKLLVWGKTRYVVVPDFFGDDMVFAAESFDGPWLGLPTENFLVGLLDKGDAMLMCVWPSGKQTAEAIASAPGPDRTIAGFQIDCLKDKSIWAAFLENSAIWHQQAIPSDAEAETALNWKPPFSARWRVDFLRPGGAAESWNFGGGGEPGEGAGQAPRDCPCRFDASRALVRVPTGNRAPPAAPLPVLVYPIDRDRATPLTAFCPMDVLRNTLGVGPCQYILQTEGLDEASPTPDTAMTWVESQFKKKNAKAAADQIKERLGQMTGHVRQAERRIQRYADFAKGAQVLLKSSESSGQPDTTKTLRPIVERLGEILATAPVAASEHSSRLADQVVGLVGKSDALAQCQRLGAEARQIGADQDRTLSNCRMAVRWLKQQARAGADRDPRGAELPRRLESEADRVLSGEP